MQIDLTGRRALVTGGGLGIGAAIARTLGAAGADVAVLYYGDSKDGALEVVAELTALGRKSVAIGADLMDPEAATASVKEAAEALGGLDIIVNNAGHMVGRATVAEMTDEHWARVMDVNSSTGFYVSRAAIPYLTESSAGRIIFMSSLAAENGGGAGSVAYAASKAALVGLCRGLAKELAGENIAVNAMAPGFIGATSFHNTFTAPEVQEAIIAGIPMKRAGTVDDVANVALFLASDLASYVTGQVIDINGGLNFR
ncbi:SDR family NAD(P)-dependent oxidoreductase [Sanguibacter antarcticus]|uniref:3-oxoacyl-[acyl-carrier protein] reductase n=1 Tax=Sanguibacter antarcticus TaxID=372484 RepID=A0A2A9E2F2_9MICO|nr:SDR family NAD(P)-dependent oxidoreductase [Sanguibacter antarcticus]PFG32360.1 3-oxoacyl-[acyl-carrier protein] reductase [Sanguibacter antarcticus]